MIANDLAFGRYRRGATFSYQFLLIARIYEDRFICASHALTNIRSRCRSSYRQYRLQMEADLSTNTSRFPVPIPPSQAEQPSAIRGFCHRLRAPTRTYSAPATSQHVHTNDFRLYC